MNSLDAQLSSGLFKNWAVASKNGAEISKTGRSAKSLMQMVANPRRLSPTDGALRGAEMPRDGRSWQMLTTARLQHNCCGF